MIEHKKPKGMKFLNDFVDKIYVLNLKKADKRREAFDEMAAEHFLDFEYFDAYGKTEVIQELVKRYPNTPSKYKFKQPSWYGKQGCKLSHLKAIEQAMKSGHKRVLIFEDDAKIYPALYRHLPHYFDELPDDFHILYLGYYIKDMYKVKNQNVSYIESPHLYSVTETHGAHAVVYNLESPEVKELVNMMLYDKFSLTVHYDLELNNLANLIGVKRLAVFPQFITQGDGFSFINQRNKTWDLNAVDPRLHIIKSGTVYNKSEGEYLLFRDIELEEGKYKILKGGYEIDVKYRNGKLYETRSKTPIKYIPIYIKKVK